MSSPREIVPLQKAIRLINHGPTTIVTAAHGGKIGIMAAAWVMPLDFNPPKVLAVIDSNSFTRELMEGSGEFALNIPPKKLADATCGVGTVSGREEPDKFACFGLKTFAAQEIVAPLVEDCVAWLECRIIRNTPNESQYDLFIAEVVAAQADPRVFSEGRWHFETAPDELRTIHHIADGHFYAIGDVVSTS